MQECGRMIRSRLAELREAHRNTVRHDGMAGLVLGVESVPDGLASGLLAGVNPVAGLYAYLFGMVGGALFTSSAFMTIQATGAMSIIVADVDLAARDDPARSLYTLSIVTGLIMVVAGVLRFGKVLRFVSKPVMTGFITAVGINIVLGQLGTFTGYDGAGGNRVARAFDLVTHIWRIDVPTTIVGVVTVALIVLLQRTPLGSLGLVVAVIAGSALAAVLNALDRDVLILDDLADVPRSLPVPTLPLFGEMPALLVPAASLAFVGLVQGAGVSAGIPNPDGAYGDASRDFVGQGAGNIVSGLFRGMPVGASMSGSSLAVAAGARTRLALFAAGAVMAVVVLVFGTWVGYVAMPALAALLMVIGVATIKPNRVMTVARTGTVALTVMVTTLVLTMLIPLQYAVLVGVGISAILAVIRESSRVSTRRLVFTDVGRMRETEPPSALPAGEVVVLQPYGNLFFAAAPTLEQQLPAVLPESTNSVVILRMRGAEEVGATLNDVLQRYAIALAAVGSKLVLVTDNDRIHRQLEVTGALATLGEENLYRGNEWVGDTVRRAHREALGWVEQRSRT